MSDKKLKRSLALSLIVYPVVLILLSIAYRVFAASTRTSTYKAGSGSDVIGIDTERKDGPDAGGKAGPIIRPVRARVFPNGDTGAVGAYDTDPEPFQQDGGASETTNPNAYSQ